MEGIFNKVRRQPCDQNPIKTGYKRVILIIGSNDLDNVYTSWLAESVSDEPITVQESVIRDLCTFFRKRLDALLSAVLKRFPEAAIGFVSITTRPYWCAIPKRWPLESG